MGHSFPEIRLRARALRPYFAKLLWALQPVHDEEVQTFAVDKDFRCYYSEKVVREWGLERCAAVLIHEILHLFLRHHARCAAIAADQKLFNMAGDLEINSILWRDGLAPNPLGTDCLYPSKFGFPDELTAEEYYALLLKQQPQDDGDGDSGDGDGEADGEGKQKPKPGAKPGQGKCGSCSGQHEDWEKPGDDPETPGQSELSKELLQRAVAGDIQKAAQTGRGTVPAGLARYAETVLAPAKVPWQTVLQSQVRAALERIEGDAALTYARPGRLTHALGEYGGAMFQSYYSPKLTVGVVVDTSGSMSHEAVQACLAETQSIVEVAGGSCLFTSVDTHATSVSEIEDVRQVVLSGGGGTDMRVGIAAMEKRRVDLCVVMSDCDTPWPSQATPFPLIICAVTASDWAIQHCPKWALTVVVE